MKEKEYDLQELDNRLNALLDAFKALRLENQKLRADNARLSNQEHDMRLKQRSAHDNVTKLIAEVRSLEEKA